MRLFRGEKIEPAVIDAGIDEVVGKQLELGIDCIGDGEFWKVRNFTYLSRHFTGIETRPLKPGEPPRHGSSPASATSSYSSIRTSTPPARSSMCPARSRCRPSASARSSPARSSRRAPRRLAQEIETFKAAIARAGRAVDETFFCVIAPGWLDHFIFNEHYKTDEEYHLRARRRAARGISRGGGGGLRPADRRSRTGRTGGT